MLIEHISTVHRRCAQRGPCLERNSHAFSHGRPKRKVKPIWSRRYVHQQKVLVFFPAREELIDDYVVETVTFEVKLFSLLPRFHFPDRIDRKLIHRFSLQRLGRRSEIQVSGKQSLDG